MNWPIKTVVKIVVKGLNFYIPHLEDGNYLLWRCIPSCGKCCYPAYLALLPRDVSNLAFKTGLNEADFLITQTHPADLKDRGPMPILKHPVKKERCQWLNKSEKCVIYSLRPHPCRVYPFNHKSINVGYLQDSLDLCPGYYPDKSWRGMADTLLEVADEVLIDLADIQLSKLSGASH